MYGHTKTRGIFRQENQSSISKWNLCFEHHFRFFYCHPIILWVLEKKKLYTFRTELTSIIPIISNFGLKSSISKKLVISALEQDSSIKFSESTAFQAQILRLTLGSCGNENSSLSSWHFYSNASIILCLSELIQEEKKIVISNVSHNESSFSRRVFAYLYSSILILTDYVHFREESTISFGNRQTPANEQWPITRYTSRDEW